MRVFISNVDTALGHSLSRHFSLSPVTNRQEVDAAAGEAAPEETPAAGEGEPTSQQVKKDVYTILGTLTEAPQSLPTQHVSKPGKMVYVGDKKRDIARKEAIEKFSVIGVKPKWVEAIVDVRITRIS